eukprot:895565-Rhodomonas_salina.1
METVWKRSTVVVIMEIVLPPCCCILAKNHLAPCAQTSQTRALSAVSFLDGALRVLQLPSLLFFSLQPCHTGIYALSAMRPRPDLVVGDCRMVLVPHSAVLATDIAQHALRLGNRVTYWVQDQQLHRLTAPDCVNHHASSRLHSVPSTPAGREWTQSLPAASKSPRGGGRHLQPAYPI